MFLISSFIIFAFIGSYLQQKSLAAVADSFYIDPLRGTTQGDGSINKPWRTLQEVIETKKIQSFNNRGEVVNPGAPIKPGSTIVLRSGFHGDISIDGMQNTDYINVVAQKGDSPKVGNLYVFGSKKWRFSGLSISPSFDITFLKKKLVIVKSNFFGAAEDIEISDNEIFSAPDITAWTVHDWLTKASDGIAVNGNRITAEHNHIKNVYFGLMSSGEHALVRGNTIENFAGDGIRGLGNNSTYEYNTIRDVYSVNDEHHDGFQSWSTGTGGVGTGVVAGVTLRGNTIVNYTNPNRPLQGNLQGIGCFDGIFSGWLVENNVIATNMWHGIALFGAIDSKVFNNTVVDLNTTQPGPPWIMITNHKNGTPSKNVVIRNNLAQGSVTGSNTANNIVSDHNLITKDLSAHFLNPSALDFKLKPGSPAIDAGSSDLSPSVDHDEAMRVDDSKIVNTGSGTKPYYDLGAYEYVTNDHPTSLQADLNLDAKVDIVDLSILLSNYGKLRASLSQPKIDINNNGIVDLYDLSILLSEFSVAR